LSTNKQHFFFSRLQSVSKEGRQMSVQFLRLGGAGKGFAGCEVVAVKILVPFARKSKMVVVGDAVAPPSWV
jgi:hypothetical protein